MPVFQHQTVKLNNKQQLTVHCKNLKTYNIYFHLPSLCSAVIPCMYIRSGCDVQWTFVSSFQVPEVEFPLDKYLQDLSFYSVEDGDRISVRW